MPFQIASPGSYYLTTNLTGFPGQNGITISADNVTLDLMGFELVGVPGSRSGISAILTITNVTIRNGTVRGWGTNGVDLTFANHGRVEEVFALRNGSYGIRAIGHFIMVNCSARENGEVGLAPGNGSIVVDCTANNNGSDGLMTGSDSVVKNCTAAYNGRHGIVAGGGSHVSACVASWNATNGIYALWGSVVSDCSLQFNTGNGIQVGGNCLVIRNNCRANGNGDGVGAGILAISNGNRIEDNNVTQNDWGIRVDGAGNFIVKNSALGNSTNYLITGTQMIGPIVTATGIITTNNPWANFSY
ncbi:MAG: right-handed parallel beta-helix repeat-containing protein [Verrucomicrobiales bacterium]|nr:right-handed parallel beta-helix repeat-containing protein [Verrucomicrobiales bacterium]